MKPKNVFADLKIYGKSYLRAKSSLFFAFVFPAVIILIFGSIFSGTGFGGSGSTTVTLYVQNLDNNSSLSTGFIQAINSSGAVTVTSVPANVAIRDYISQHSISNALVIPAGFSGAFLNHSHVNLTFYYNPSASTSGTALAVIQSVEQEFNSNFTVNKGPIFLNTASVSSSANNFASYLIPGLIGFVILTSPMFSMTYVVSSYKREKIFRQLSLTPLTKSEWFVSKFLWYFIISALSAAEIMAIAFYMFGSQVSFTFLMIPFLLLGVFLFTSLGVLAGAVSKTEEGASVLGNIITFPMMFLAGTFFPISIMPSWLQTFAHGLPLFYIIDGLNSVMLYSNMSAALNDSIISIGLAVVIFIATYSVFSWKEEKSAIGKKTGGNAPGQG